MTAQGILYHFGSKEALLLAVIAERDRRLGSVIAELWDPSSPRPALESFRASVRFAQISEREPGLTALNTVLQAESLEPDHPAHYYFRERSHWLREMVELTLRFGQETGEVREEVDCAAKAQEWIAYLDGAATLWLADPTVSLVELYRNFAETFIQSVEADPGFRMPVPQRQPSKDARPDRLNPAGD